MNRDVPRTLTPVVFHTLLALSSGPLHGYAISREVESASGGRVRMGPGTLYGSLQRMQKSGLVLECERLVENEGPHGDRRRYYELTGAGEQALRHEVQRLREVVELDQFRALQCSGQEV